MALLQCVPVLYRTFSSVYETEGMKVYVAAARVGKIDRGLTVRKLNVGLELSADICVLYMDHAEYIAAQLCADLKGSVAVSVNTNVESLNIF